MNKKGTRTDLVPETAQEKVEVIECLCREWLAGRKPDACIDEICNVIFDMDHGMKDHGYCQVCDYKFHKSFLFEYNGWNVCADCFAKLSSMQEEQPDLFETDMD